MTLPELHLHTRPGYMADMLGKTKTACLKRLHRIEGQVRGLGRMIEADRYCIDIITQISAVRAALRRVEGDMLRDHVGHCVKRSFASGSLRERRRTIDELLNVLGRVD